MFRGEGVAAVRGVGGKGRRNPVAAIVTPPLCQRMDLANMAGGLFLRLAVHNVLLVSQVLRQYFLWSGKAAWLCCRQVACFKNCINYQLWTLMVALGFNAVVRSNRNATILELGHHGEGRLR